MKKGKRTTVTQTEFTKLKALTNVGVTPKVFTLASGRSHIVYDMVKKAKDFKDYERLKAERVKKYRTPVAPVQNVTQQVPLPVVKQLVELTGKIDSLITAVNSLLVVEEDKHIHEKVTGWKFGRK